MKLYGYINTSGNNPEGELILFHADDMTAAVLKVANMLTLTPPWHSLPAIRVYETRLPTSQQ